MNYRRQKAEGRRAGIPQGTGVSDRDEEQALSVSAARGPGGLSLRGIGINNKP